VHQQVQNLIIKNLSQNKQLLLPHKT